MSEANRNWAQNLYHWRNVQKNRKSYLFICFAPTSHTAWTVACIDSSWFILLYSASMNIFFFRFNSPRITRSTIYSLKAWNYHFFNSNLKHNFLSFNSRSVNLFVAMVNFKRLWELFLTSVLSFCFNQINILLYVNAWHFLRTHKKNYANGAAQHANNLILRLLFNFFVFISTQNQTNFFYNLAVDFDSWGSDFWLFMAFWSMCLCFLCYIFLFLCILCFSNFSSS